MQSKMITQAWVYLGSETCTAPAEYSDGRRIVVLKPEYYTVRDNGTLQLLTSGCNGYSVDNAADIRAHSEQQFVTISSHILGMSKLAGSQALTSTFISTILDFLDRIKFTGVELDFEDFGAWSGKQYADYKTFVKTVGDALHAKGYKLMIDGPAISDDVYQGYYPWKWEDFKTLPVDYLVVMAYDYQADQGAGNPVAPLAWIKSICEWMKNNITDHSKIVVGLNSYGYHAPTGSYTATNDTYEQSKLFPGFGSAARDTASGEMMWSRGNTIYNYSDQTTLDMKLNMVRSAGINNVSFWHLGGNLWPASLASVPGQQPALTIAYEQIRAARDLLTPEQRQMIIDVLQE